MTVTTHTQGPIFVREGSPFRTDDELSRLFVFDVFVIASKAMNFDAAQLASELVEDLNVSPIEFGRLSAYEDHIEDIVTDADDLLESMGFYVEWADGDDGYSIYRDPVRKR